MADIFRKEKKKTIFSPFLQRKKQLKSKHKKVLNMHYSYGREEYVVKIS